MTFPQRYVARILENRMPAPGIHEITFARNGFLFRAGEEITVCGSNDMISEMRTLLLSQGCGETRIFAEPYYFW